MPIGRYFTLWTGTTSGILIWQCGLSDNTSAQHLNEKLTVHIAPRIDNLVNVCDLNDQIDIDRTESFSYLKQARSQDFALGEES